MTTTDIYQLGRIPCQLGATRNAWRGGMYVWDDIARRYFRMKNFPMFDNEARMKVWNAHKHVAMPRHEIVVLLTTMDCATVDGADVSAICEAFERYGREHPNSSFGEQAAILRSANLTDADWIAWQQTSVSEFWGVIWNDEGDEPTWYDPAIGDRHFDAYAEAIAKAAQSAAAIP